MSNQVEGYSDEVRAEARARYEAGESIYSIAKALGPSEQTLRKWRTKQQWVEPKQGEAEPIHGDAPPIDVVPMAPPPVAISAPDETEGELRRRIATLEGRLANAEAEVDKYKPTVDISDRLGVVSIEALEARHDDAYWVEKAADFLAAENVARHRAGKPAIDVRDPAVAASFIPQAKAAELGKYRHMKQGPANLRRSIKMVHPRCATCSDLIADHHPLDGHRVEHTLVGIALEPQINNTAGSMADGIVRYTNKGFKLPDPFLCSHSSCYAPAAVSGAGQFTHGGYCTQEHHDAIERGITEDNKVTLTPQSGLLAAAGR